MKEAKFKIDPNCWTMDFYNIAYENLKNEKIPVVIPSYNRWNKCATLNQMRKNKKESWPIYLVVRESQKELYEENYGDIDDLTIVAFEDEKINDSGKTRHQIVDYFSQKFKSIFMLDDDLNLVLKSRAKYVDENGVEHNKAALHKSTSKYTDPARILAMWQLAHEYISEKYEDECWCTSLRSAIWTIGVNNVSDRSYKIGGVAFQAVCVNLDILNNNNINYLSTANGAQDDLEVLLHAMTRGLFVVNFSFLNLVSNEKESVISQDMNFNNIEDRLVYLDLKTLQQYKDFRFVKKNNKDRAIIRWDKYLKALGIYDRYGSIEHELYDKLVNYI